MKEVITSIKSSDNEKTTFLNEDGWKKIGKKIVEDGKLDEEHNGKNEISEFNV